MSVDKQELRRLAEAVECKSWHQHGYLVLNHDCETVCETFEDDPVDATFIAAANPAAILSLLDELERAESDAERLRMQLVACGVVAMCNTPDSADKARDMHPDYMSASCQDVMRAVDAEMALRAELEQYRKDALRYRWLRGRLPGSSYRIAGVIYSEGGEGIDEAIDAAMAKEQSQ